MENKRLFSYFPANVKIVKPIGVIDIEQMHQAIRSPKPEIIQVFEKIRLAAQNADEAEKQRLKEHLFYFTPAVKIGNRRSYDGILNFTGYMPLDFDKLDHEYAKEFKHFLFNDHNFILSAWLSASGNGVRAIAKIPICKDVDEFKLYFSSLEQYNPANFRQYNGFDPITKNPTQPVFLSHDPEILTRPDCETWAIKWIDEVKKNDTKFKSYAYSNDRVERRIRYHIEKINDQGHPILRAASYTLGGYVGGGETTKDEAINLINEIIETHNYLRQKADIYKKTALTMIEKGMQKPLYL